MINLTNPPTDLSQITSETAPTTRADGSALQVGDRWYKSSTQKTAFRIGSAWLGKARYSNVVYTTAQTAGVALDLIPTGNIYFEEIGNAFFQATNTLASHYLTRLSPRIQPDGAVSQIDFSASYLVPAYDDNPQRYKEIIALGYVLNIKHPLLTFSHVAVGSPSIPSGSAYLKYREVLG